METWSEPSSLSIVLLIVAALAFVWIAYYGARSKLRVPGMIPAAWEISGNCCRTHTRLLALLAAMVSLGAALQWYFRNVDGYDEISLLVSSVAWQAVMATVVAMVAVPIHLFVVQVALARNQYNGQPSVEVTYPQNFRTMLARAAALGFGIWMLSYGLEIASKATANSASREYQDLVYQAANLASFAVMAFVSLARPALSLGSSSPLRDGIAMASKNMAALYLLSFLMAAAPAVVGHLLLVLPLAFLRLNDASMLGPMLYLIFTVFQIVAVEVATIIFAAQVQKDTCSPHIEVVMPVSAFGQAIAAD